jgi:hypothetical protein
MLAQSYHEWKTISLSRLVVSGPKRKPDLDTGPKTSPTQVRKDQGQSQQGPALLMKLL